MTLRRASLAASLVLVHALAFGGAAHADPLFSRVDGAYGTQPCPDDKHGPGCFTNYALIVDLEGHTEVLYPNADGYFSHGQPQPFVAYSYQGGAFVDVSARLPYTGYARQVAVADVDGDGDLDVYLPAAWGDPDALFIQTAGTFKDEAAERLGGRRSNAAAARFGDLDGDGDLDLVVTEGWATSRPEVLHVLTNDGSGHFAQSGAVATPPGTTQPIDVDLFDADGDFDLDVWLDSHEGASVLLVNDGAAHFEVRSTPKESNKRYDPAVCDIDGDGDLDVVVDNARADQTEMLLVNDGHGQFVDETAARIKGNKPADDNGVACLDVDGDGDFDLLVASLDDVERVFLNDGSGHFTRAAGDFDAFTDSTLGIDVGDVDGDGRLDVATGQGESDSYANQFYRGGAGVPVDVTPPKIRAVDAWRARGDADVLRFAVTDAVTSDVGPRVSAFLKIGDVIVPGHHLGGDLFEVAVSGPRRTAAFEFTPCATDLRGNTGCGAAARHEGVGADAGAPAGPAAQSSGCSCSATRRVGAAFGGVTLLVVAFAAARRLRGSRRSS